MDKSTKKPLFVSREPEFSSKARMAIGTLDLKNVFISLLHSVLIVCEEQNLENPILIVCLDGLEAKATFTDSFGPGVELSHRDGFYQTRSFYFLN